MVHDQNLRMISLNKRLKHAEPTGHLHRVSSMDHGLDMWTSKILESVFVAFSSNHPLGWATR